ncbi:serine protease [Pontiellaceae bacterium B1224]|nr:serine protease [Pontiellaceae bacterium B1224]
MIKRMLTFLLTLLAGLNVLGGEVEDALQKVNAPPGEFVRMPTTYIFQRLEREAQNSGIPILGSFAIQARVDGVDTRKISISFENMNMLEALNAVAVSTGTVLGFDGTIAFLGDDSMVEVATVNVVEEPEEEEDDGKGVQFSDVDAALVFVETGVGRGSAFVAEQDGKTYLFSNQHNFMGATQLELLSMHGGPVKFDRFEFSRTRDLVRFELNLKKNKQLGVLNLAEKPPYIGQEIAIYGNSAGGNVATELRGEVLGVGPYDIEVDADIVSGNSGSPILDFEGRVLGVATYVAFGLKFDKEDERKQIFRGTRFGKTRRYGVRIPDDGWVKVDMRAFLNQTYLIADTRNILQIMHILVEYWNGDEDYEASARQILSSYSSRSDRVSAPYEFHFPKTEEEIRLMVKAFNRNYQEFVGLVRNEDFDKKELAKISNPKSLVSTSKLQSLDYHIRTTMLGKAKKVHDDLAGYRWMSDYLKESAEPLDEMASELVRSLESEKNLGQRIKAVM